MHAGAGFYPKLYYTRFSNVCQGNFADLQYFFKESLFISYPHAFAEDGRIDQRLADLLAEHLSADLPVV